MKKTIGFTLIELLVVVAIIGVLATIIILNLTGAKERSRDASRKSDLQTVATALNSYFTENDYYPGPDGGATAWSMYVFDRNTATNCGTVCSNSGVDKLTPTYFTTIPSDPKRSGSWIADSTRCHSYPDYLYVGQSSNANSRYSKVTLMAKLENTSDTASTEVKTNINTFFNNSYFAATGSGGTWSSASHTLDDCSGVSYNYWITLGN